jgi:hypothetical protein
MGAESNLSWSHPAHSAAHPHLHSRQKKSKTIQLSLVRHQLRSVDLADPAVTKGVPADQITVIDLGQNYLPDPPSLRGFSSLVLLNLSANEMTSAPVLDGCPRLESLILANNLIKELPAATVLSWPASLTNLNLKMNQITSLAALEPVARNLVTLSVSSNRIASIAGMPALPRLQALFIHSNQVAEPPEVVMAAIAGLAPGLQELGVRFIHGVGSSVVDPNWLEMATRALQAIKWVDGTFVTAAQRRGDVGRGP